MSGRVAIITGAGTGIGKAVALALGKRGYHVMLAGRRADLLEDVAAQIPGAVAAPTDVCDEKAVDALFADCVARFGRVDLLFNNAGINRAVPIEDFSVEDWRRIVDTNLTGSFLCLKAAYKQMKFQTPRGGRIINNGSIAATTPRPQMIAYTATKHAITGLTKAAGLDGRAFDIAVCQIDIGNAQTNLSKAQSSGVIQADGSMKVEAMMDVDHVGEAVAYMDSLPLEANVPFMTIMATKMPFLGRG